MARTILDPQYKQHLNEYDGAGEVAEVLLNSGIVQALLKGNESKISSIHKVLQRAGVQTAGSLNGKDLMKKINLILGERTRENKLKGFLNALELALQAVDGEIENGIYFY